MKYTAEGCRNGLLIGLRRLNDAVVVGVSIMLDGYVLGEIILSRSSLTADILYMFLNSGEIVVMARSCIGVLKTP